VLGHRTEGHHNHRTTQHKIMQAAESQP